MGASSDRKITLDYDRQLQADGFDHFVRLRFENSHAGGTHSHKWVDVHSTIVGGVATNLDEPVTLQDRQTVKLLCATAYKLQGEPGACIEAIGKIAKAVWGEDVSNAWGDLLAEGVDEEDEEDVLDTMNGWIAYLIALGAFLGVN